MWWLAFLAVLELSKASVFIHYDKTGNEVSRKLQRELAKTGFQVGRNIGTKRSGACPSIPKTSSSNVVRIMTAPDKFGVVRLQFPIPKSGGDQSCPFCEGSRSDDAVVVIV